MLSIHVLDSLPVSHFLSEARVNLLSPIQQLRPLQLLGPVRRAAGGLVDLTVTALPHGGQRGARRNAWGSMVADSTRARLRDEAQVAVERSLARTRRQEARALRQAR